MKYFPFALEPQPIFIGALCVLVSLLIVVFLAKKSHGTAYEPINYGVLTKAEQYFYKVLDSSLQGRLLIFPKVRIADIVSIKKTVKKKHFWSYFKNISQRHIDYVLVDPNTFQTICLIELDDKSHAQSDRVERDRFVNKMFSDVGIPLYRFKVRRRYDRAAILDVLSPSLNAPTITK